MTETGFPHALKIATQKLSGWLKITRLMFPRVFQSNFANPSRSAYSAAWVRFAT